MKKRLFFIVLSIVMIVTLTACENKNESGGGLFNKALKASDLSIEDFEWETISSKYKGSDCYVFSMTNNSKYDIIAVEFSYKVKDEVSEAELGVYDDFMNEHEGYIEEDDSPKGVTLRGSRNILVSKGETLTDLRFTVGYEDLCWYDYPTDEQFTLMEPEELEIGVVGEDNKLYIAYYDFESEKWKLDTETLDVDIWSKSEIAKKIEKPVGKHHVITDDGEDCFEIQCYGVTKEDYNVYTKRMAELGFVDDDPSSTYYTATSDDGYELDLWYTEDEFRLKISIEKE